MPIFSRLNMFHAVRFGARLVDRDDQNHRQPGASLANPDNAEKFQQKEKLAAQVYAAKPTVTGISAANCLCFCRAILHASGCQR